MIALGITEAFQLQGFWCRQFGSDLYGELLDRAGADIAAEGVVARLVAGWSGNPFSDVLPLRLLGAVHRLVLGGDAPQLAPFYPSVGGTPAWPEAWDAFVEVLKLQEETVRHGLQQGVQTNETSRCAALLGGFLRVAAATARPLRLLEIGGSAGLNLMWDRYHYRLARPGRAESRVGSGGSETEGDAGEWRWGNPHSPAIIRADWEGPPPELDAPVTVRSRAGCDIAPIDITDDAQVRMLESFVWADQCDRLAQLRAAVSLARRDPPQLDRAAAAAWLKTQLARPVPETATIVFHSVIWWYLSEGERDAVTEVISEAGRRATDTAPLAWLRMEIGSTEIGAADVRLRLWPAGDDVLLARAHPHGRHVAWCA